MNSPRNGLNVYVAVEAVVWISIIVAVASVLRGSSSLGQVLLILLGGAFVFIVLLPMAWRVPPTRGR